MLRISKNTSAGLTGVLSGTAKLKDAIARFSDIGIHVLTAGVIPPNPAELLGGAKMKALIEEMESMYDIILFDTPPVSVVTDAAVLSQFADGVIMVIRQKHATIEQAQLAKRNLETVNANLIGVVMNDFDMKSTNRESGYYYSYYYDYSSKDKE